MCEEIRPINTVGIIGLGALGILFGERLISSGVQVVILADEERVQRYRTQKFTCNGQIVPFVYASPKDAQPVDLLIFATKASGLASAMDTASHFIGRDTLILSVLNGISSEETIAARFGRGNVLYCTAQGMDAVKSDGALTYAHAGMIVLGEREPGAVTPRVQHTADFLNTHNVCAQPVCDMVRRQWGKLMLNVGINQSVMVFEGNYGTVQKQGRPREVMLEAMREVQRLSVLEGYPLSDAEVDEWVALADTLSPAGMPSMRQDGRAHRKSEVELFAGTIIRRAARYGLAVPVNQWLYDTIQRMETAY